MARGISCRCQPCAASRCRSVPECRRSTASCSRGDLYGQHQRLEHTKPAGGSEKLGRTRHDQEPKQCDGYRDDTVDDEEPCKNEPSERICAVWRICLTFPPREPMDTVQAVVCTLRSLRQLQRLYTMVTVYTPSAGIR